MMAEINVKNIARGSTLRTEVEDGIYMLKFQNEDTEIYHAQHEIGSGYIQFHFCLNGAAKFNFNQGNYAFDIQNEESLLLYNPQKDLPLDLELNDRSRLISIMISIKKFHSLFSQEAHHIHFLTEDNKDKKYYDHKNLEPAITVVLNQLLNSNIHKSVEKIYHRAKTYELLSLYFNRTEEADIEQCPFLVDEQNVLKIRKAKQIIIARMTEPPRLKELADETGLSLKKLKDGFKQIYGTSVYSFLFDYKMEVARKLLEGNQHNVNEIGLKVGYSTSSHFIAAFKKKFGTTPKKYNQ